MNLTDEAAEALLNVRHARQGGEVPAYGATAVELRQAGLIGDDRGLTRKGLIERERIQEKRLGDAFGPL